MTQISKHYRNSSLKLADYGIDYNLGPASTHVDIGLFIEGIRQ